MYLNITARRFKLPDDLRQYVEEKSLKLGRYHEGILGMDIILGWERQSRYVEMIIDVNQRKVIVKEESDDLRKSFDLVLDRAERQLKKHKAKVRSIEKDKVHSA